MFKRPYLSRRKRKKDANAWEFEISLHIIKASFLLDWFRGERRGRWREGENRGCLDQRRTALSFPPRAQNWMADKQPNATEITLEA